MPASRQLKVHFAQIIRPLRFKNMIPVHLFRFLIVHDEVLRRCIAVV
jgi:hypothetical protein